MAISHENQMARFQREERERRERATFEEEERVRQEQAARLLRTRPTQRPLVSSVREPEHEPAPASAAPSLGMRGAESFTKTPNAIFDRLIGDCELDPYSALVLLYICRQTIGWGRSSVDTLSLSETARALHIARRTVATALSKLETSGLIRRERRSHPAKGAPSDPPRTAHEITRITITLPREKPPTPSAYDALP